MGPRRAPFVLYTFRHTSITRWAKHMDPFTLHVLAGHTDMKTMKRYVHPSDTDILDAMGRVRAAFRDTASMTNRTMLPIARTMDAHSGRRHCSTAR